MKSIFLLIAITACLLTLSVNAVFAVGSDTVENLYFSIDIPDSWTCNFGD
jgi:hypothetical protein